MAASSKVYRLNIPVNVGDQVAATDISDLKSKRSACMVGGASSGTLQVMLGDAISQLVEAEGWAWNDSTRGEERDDDNTFTHARVERLRPGSGEAVLLSGEVDAAAQAAQVAPQALDVTVSESDLTDAAATQTLNLGAALPANARILGVGIDLVTPFTGGTLSAMTLDIGSAGDIDALVAGANVFAAAADGQASSRPAGVAPNKHFVASTQLQVRFTATGDDVANATAGQCRIKVMYFVLA